MPSSHFAGVIGRTIIDDEPFDNIETGDFARQFTKSLRKMLRLIQTWNLYNELHEKIVTFQNRKF